jgi:DNA-binding LacI/PurR family transcriptional regulator
MPKRITIKDVAAQAGVSYQTVSKVINGRAQVHPDTEARVWQIVEALSYKPHHSARNLRAQRSRMIGYSWVPARPDEANHILDQFITSMVKRLRPPVPPASLPHREEMTGFGLPRVD